MKVPLVIKHGLLENSPFIDDVPMKTPITVYYDILYTLYGMLWNTWDISWYTWDIIRCSFAMFPRGSRCNNSEVFQTADGRLQGR